MTDLTPIIVPVLVAVILSATGGVIVARFTPGNPAYVAVLEKRLAVVQVERDEYAAHLGKLEARISALEAQVDALIAEGLAKDRELARLYRRLDADEARLAEPRRPSP